MTEEEKEILKYIEEVEDVRLSAIDHETRECRHQMQLLIAAIMAYKFSGRSFRFSEHSSAKEKALEYISAYRKMLYSDIVNRISKIMAISVRKNKELYGIDYEIPKGAAEKFFTTELFGESTKQRLSKYTSKLLYEAEAYIAAGINAGMSPEAVAQQYIQHILKPFSAPLVQGAIAKGNFDAIRLASGGVHFGKGVSSSAMFNIRTVTQDSLQRAFQMVEQEIYKVGGIKGYTIHRGSGYDCPICNHLPGKIYPITEWILPAHNRCCCFSVPVLR